MSQLAQPVAAAAVWSPATGWALWQAGPIGLALLWALV